MIECNTLDEYQEKAKKTAIYPETAKIVYPTLGLTGEAGEVANKVKKVIRDHDGCFTSEVINEISSELGDVLWYIAALASDMGLTLKDIAERNLYKLHLRQINGKLQGSGDQR